MFATKKCPSCGAVMFEDMDICYECLSNQSKGDLSSKGEHLHRPKKPWLLRIHASTIDVTVPVPSGGLVIGRGSSCDVVLHAQLVSRAHVRVESVGEGLVARDLGATNRARVGKTLVGDETPLREGDILCVCGTEFEVLS